MTFEHYILQIIEGKRKAPITKALLTLMSSVYRTGVSLRHFVYKRFLKQTRLKIPVISVGNIVAGGSGKTPFVMYLAKVLSSKNVWIASRGYRRKSHKTIIVDGNTSAEDSGDEPLLLSQKVPNATIIVEKSRAHSGQIAQKKGAEILILDDGMQHLGLYRDIEIVVMHADDLFGKDHFLPRGLLRDSPKRLQIADHIILNGVENEEHFEKLQNLLSHYTDAPITAMQINVENSIELASKKVATFCAIAHPKRFYKTLQTLGCDIILSEEKPDHLPFTREEITRIANRAKGAEAIVCTEKDAIKLEKDLPLSIPLIPLRISYVPTFGKEALEKRIYEVQTS